MYNKIRNSEKTIDYTVLNQINEHALKYDTATDKKDFLKNVCAYEQKIILLNSIRPYDVLSYLNELDLESSRLVLSELNDFEIKKIIDLFTSEDKKNFYSNFSDLKLVNQFIKNDKNSYDYVDDLSLNRKIELIDSAKVETAQATEKIYKTMSEEEKGIVSTKITKPEASSVLNYVENSVEISVLESDLNDNNIEERTDTIKLELEKEQLNNEDKLVNEEILEEVNKFKDEFLRVNLQFLKENYKEFEEVDVDKYNLLPEELKIILDKTIEETRVKEEQEKLDKEDIIETEEELIENKKEVNGEDFITVEEYDKYSIIGDNISKVSIVSNPKKINEFKHETEIVELKQINDIKNIVEKTKLENIKTL